MLSHHAMELIERRGLDVELLDRMGVGSGDKNWPVTDERGDVTWHPGEALIIPFVRNGEVVRRKFKRTVDIPGAPAYLQEKGGPRIAFNEDCLRDDGLLGQPVIITEGELDALAAIQCGFTRTISVPDGAPPPGERSREDLMASAKWSWLADVKPFLTPERAPEIIIAADGDENGAAMLQDLSVILMRSRCKYLTYPKAPEHARAGLGRERCKDLNEVLQFYGQKGVVETINRATFLRVDGVYLMGELPPLPSPQIFDIGFRLLSEHYKARLGDFIVITGVPGLGKTTFTNDLCCRLALNHGLKIAWASFEQSPQRDHKRALRSWYGVARDSRLDIDPDPYAPTREGVPAYRMTPEQLSEADAWIDQHHVFIVPGEDDDVTLDWLLDRMEAAVVQYGVKVIVIDPWNEMDHSRARDETMTEYVGRSIKTMRRFARKFQVHLIVVAHPTKSLKDGDGKYKMPTLYDISDSANWYNKCDLGIIVHRESDIDTLIKVQKSRYHEEIGRPGEVVMQYGKDDRRFHESQRVA